MQQKLTSLRFTCCKPQWKCPCLSLDADMRARRRDDSKCVNQRQTCSDATAFVRSSCIHRAIGPKKDLRPAFKDGGCRWLTQVVVFRRLNACVSRTLGSASRLLLPMPGLRTPRPVEEDVEKPPNADPSRDDSPALNGFASPAQQNTSQGVVSCI